MGGASSCLTTVNNLLMISSINSDCHMTNHMTTKLYLNVDQVGVAVLDICQLSLK